MPYKNSKSSAFERLSFLEDNIFFDSFVLEGREKNILGLENIPRVIDAAGLCICLEGEGEIVLNAQSYKIKQGDMCVVFPNDIVHVTKKSEDFKGYTIVCTPDFLVNVNVKSSTSLFLYIKDNPCISLGEKDQKDLIRMCDFLKEHDSRTNHPCREEISKILASAIIYEVVGIYQKGEPLRQQPYSRKNKLYFDFTQLIAKNFGKQKNVDFYADKLCITARYLSVICKEISGLTATECINHYIMTNARVMLSTTDMTILQISEELSFPNPSFFTQFFKKHQGITPKMYRTVSQM